MNKHTRDYIKPRSRSQSGYKKRQQKSQTLVSPFGLFLILLVVGCIAAWMMGFVS